MGDDSIFSLNGSRMQVDESPAKYGVKSGPLEGDHSQGAMKRLVPLTSRLRLAMPLAVYEDLGQLGQDKPASG